MVVSNAFFCQVEKLLNVRAAVQVKCTAGCFAPAVCMWHADKGDARQGGWMAQLKFAPKHYKPTIKLAPQKNTWPFLVGHKKPRDTFASATIATLFCFTRNTRHYFEAVF